MALVDNIRAFFPLGEAITVKTMADSTGRGNDLSKHLIIDACTVQFRMGRNSAPVWGATNPQQLYGSIKGWGRWNRILTAGEKAALANKEYWPFNTTPTLQNGLLAYFPLDEAGGSATYADATSRGNDLTATGTTVRVAGPAGTDYGTQLGDGIYLTKSSPGTDLQSRQENCTIAGWVLFNSQPPGISKQQIVWGQLDNDTSKSGFNVYYDPTANRFCADTSAGDDRRLDASSALIESNFGAPSTAIWYLVIYEFDLTNNRATISVNNGTATTLTPILQPTTAAGKIATASQFRLNPTFNFATRTTGWDYESSYPVSGNCKAFKASPSADLKFGNNAKTVWGWLKAIDTATYQTITGIFGGAGASTDWIVQLSANYLYFVLGLQQAYCRVAFSDTTAWHLLVAWFDKAGNRIYIDIDHGALTANATGPVTPQTVATDFAMGADKQGDNGHNFKGLLEAWGIADGIPSQADLDTLWNNGNGYLYAPAAGVSRGRIVNAGGIGSRNRAGAVNI